MLPEARGQPLYSVASTGTASHWPGIHHVGYSSESQPSSSFCLPSSIIKNISHYFFHFYFILFFVWVPETILKFSLLQVEFSTHGVTFPLLILLFLFVCFA